MTNSSFGIDPIKLKFQVPDVTNIEVWSVEIVAITESDITGT